MRNKPLINQSCLQKISGKAQHFMIRNKMSLSKGPRPQRTTTNVQTSDHAMQQQILYCSQIIQKCIEEGYELQQEDGTRILKILKQARRKFVQRVSVISHEDFEQSSSMVLRASQNRKSKGRLDTLEDGGQSNSQERTNNVELVMTKSKSGKLKLGKQNANRNPVLWQMKLERLQGRIEEYQIKNKEYENKIEQMKQEINTLNDSISQNIRKISKVQRQKEELATKASKLVMEKVEIESNLKFQVIELQQKVQNSMMATSILEERLQERQKEIIAIYQSKSQ